MKQLGMVVLMLLCVASLCAAQDEVMSSPVVDESAQPMPADTGYAQGAVVESGSTGSSCGCGSSAPVVESAPMDYGYGCGGDCGCVCAPATYCYDGCGCGYGCGCGRMGGCRPMFGGFFGRSRCCCY
jgi:hypothetical protein